jgi:hypothetical protein
MGQIKFEHEECNAWGVFTRQSIDAASAKNMHIAEIKIQADKTGRKTYTLNGDHKTVCGESINDKEKQLKTYSENASDFRSKLAQLQNDGNEVCGVCVSHFYADPEQH